MPLPKTFHYIWLGNKPMHPLMDQWRTKWANLHPLWEIKIWRGGSPSLPIPRLTCNNEILESRFPDYLKLCPTFAKKSDVWRYDLLERLGGIYLDTDFEPIKNIEPIVEDKEAFAGQCITKYDWSETNPTGKLKTETGCSIIGASAHHPWVRELFDNVRKQDPTAQLSLAFPYITEITARHPEIHLFAPDVFYPIRWDECEPQTHHKPKPLTEETYAVHRWSSQWFPNGLRKI